MLERIEVRHFRNLETVDAVLGPGLNLVVGPNASGKTSLLEAVYVLGRGRSFRGRQPRDWIQEGHPALRVLARVRDGDGVRVAGLQRRVDSFEARLGGNPVQSLAELASAVPVLLLTPDSHRLFSDPPGARRRFLDWGIYQSQRGFLDTWRAYARALAHRNAALRGGASPREVSSWDSGLVGPGEALDAARREYCARLDAALAPLFAELVGGQEAISLEYRRGWSRERDLAGLLAESVDGDRQAGHTRSGPHRGDFGLRLGGRAIAERLSRGQQKLLAVALTLAQATLYRADHGSSALLLVDDLASELDVAHRARVLACLRRQPLQLLVTALHEAALPWRQWPDARAYALTAGALTELV